MNRQCLGALVALMLLAGCATTPPSPISEETRALLAGGRYDEAEGALASALKTAPNHPELRIALSQIREARLTQALARERAAARQAEQAREAAARQAESPAEGEKGLAKASTALDKPITVDFKEASLNQICQVLFKTAGLNFAFDRDVRQDQTLSLSLRKTPVKDVLRLVLLSQQLEQRPINDTTVLIYPKTAAKARDYQDLSVRSFYLTNIDAKTAMATVRTILKARDLVADEKQNVLVMRDTPEAIRMAEKLLAVHDVPEPEVMLEVEVLEIKRTRLQELGMLWPTALMLTPISTTAGAALTLKDLLHGGQAALGATVPSFGINARADRGDTNLLANPRIRTRNRETAKILIGDRVPNITTTANATGFIAESVQYIDIGLKLEVQPTIYLDDEVAIRVNLEVSNIVSQVQTKSGTLAYQIGTRNASTVLRLKDGENQVLAGLISDEERNSANKVPGLGDLPLAGRLFGSKREDGQKTELVLSMTPRLIRNIRRPALAQTEFSLGPESSLRALSPDLSAFTEVVPPPMPASPPPAGQ